MKNGIKKAYYTAQDPKTYLVAALSDQVSLEEFCVEMAQRNHISALLPMQDRFMNGTTELLFDISGKSRLIDVFKGIGDAKAMVFVLLDCCKSFMELYDYFLHPAQCILDVDYIFIGDKQQICFALVPISAEPIESNNELKKMFLELVGSCSAVTDKEKADILGYLIKPNFSLQEFKALLEKYLGIAKEDIGTGAVKKQIPAALQQPIAPIQPEKKSLDIPKPTDEPSAKKSVAKEIQIPGGGKVAIPTAEKQTDKKTGAEHQKAAKENKGFLGGLFGKKKEEALDLNIEMHQVQGGAVATPARPPVVDTPAPAGQGLSGQWRGTVDLQSAGRGQKTEFIDETAGVKRLVLIHNGRQIPVTAFPFTVGRELCSYLINNPKVSRQHITISFEGGIYTITDNNSANHTYYNDSMLAPFTAYELEDGAELRLGNETILISIK